METTEIIELVKLAKRHQIVSCAFRDFMDIMWPSLTSEQRHEVETLRAGVARDLEAADNLDDKLAKLLSGAR